MDQMSLTEDQKKEVQHLCRVLGIGKLEAIARVLGQADEPSEPEPWIIPTDTTKDTTTLDE